MTNISGLVTDVGLVGSHGRLIVQAVEFYGDGDEVVVPSPVSFPIAAGVVSANVSPGAARLTIHVGSSRRDWFVNVPESDVGLGDLIEAFTEYEPPVVSAAIAARDAAVQARDEAVAAAGDVDAAIAGAADAVVQAVESDRVAAESAAGAAASSASDADVSAGDASAAAGAAAQSASDADGSASAAASSAAAASGSATSAAGSATDAAGAVTDARAARDAAEGHATSAAGSASAAASSATAADGHADRAEAAANEFDLTASSSTLAPGASATVTVSGDGPAYSLAFGVPQGPKGDKGDEGEISQAQLDAAVASLVDNAPEALNTLSELSTALGDDPNFATTVSTEIGKRALIDGAPAAYDTLGKLVAALQNHELGGSTDASLLTGALTDQVDVSAAEVTLPSAPGAPYGLAQGLDMIVETANSAFLGLSSKSDVGHQHPVTDLTTTGTASSSTYLRGDGSWATPTNTTYSVPTQAEAEAGTATTARAFSAQRVRQAIDAHPRVAAAPATWKWTGTTLPTAASQVHAQARVGDFIVAPNLTTSPGWHQITGV